MDRFHIVVANYQKLKSFVENFGKIIGFNADVDKVYVFDCSSEYVWRSELALTQQLHQYGLVVGQNLFFIRRRDWGLIHGAQLDYFRLILDGHIQVPNYSAFMQDHFLDLINDVKEDTLPEDCVYNLNEIARKYETDSQLGCVFHSRYGIRISVSNPVTDSRNEFYGDGEVLLEKAVRRGFLVDGGNFIVRPKLYLEWFYKHPMYLTVGDGSYGFSHVWEVRLGQILYDQKIKWCDLSRNLEYSTIEELDKLEIELSKKISKLWYDDRVWYFYYGMDQCKYLPLPLKSVLRYFPILMAQRISYPRDKRLVFCQPEDFVKS